MSRRIPLPQLAAALTARGFTAPGYRAAYLAALDARIPAEKGPNGRWPVAEDNLALIAATLGCERRTIADAA